MKIVQGYYTKDFFDYRSMARSRWTKKLLLDSIDLCLKGKDGKVVAWDDDARWTTISKIDGREISDDESKEVFKKARETGDYMAWESLKGVFAGKIYVISDGERGQIMDYLRGLTKTDLFGKWMEDAGHTYTSKYSNYTELYAPGYEAIRHVLRNAEDDACRKPLVEYFREYRSESEED
ncbi:hypothetical protein COO72_11980 [Bifidobacterium callitrichos]|nr:hypothetical protein COO72_11980 [Bifidobacterium callitrichos]